VPQLCTDRVCCAAAAAAAINSIINTWVSAVEAGRHQELELTQVRQQDYVLLVDSILSMMMIIQLGWHTVHVDSADVSCGTAKGGCSHQLLRTDGAQRTGRRRAVLREPPQALGGRWRQVVWL
jgi:hypothetical protein